MHKYGNVVYMLLPCHAQLDWASPSRESLVKILFLQLCQNSAETIARNKTALTAAILVRTAIMTAVTLAVSRAVNA